MLAAAGIVVEKESEYMFEMYGDFRENCVRDVRRLPGKLVGNFGSRNYFDSDLLRLRLLANVACDNARNADDSTHWRNRRRINTDHLVQSTS